MNLLEINLIDEFVSDQFHWWIC